MEPLARRRCVPCEGGAPPLTGERSAALLAQLDGWTVENAGDHEQLFKLIRFPDFRRAVEFVDLIAPIADAEAHHPDLLVGWGRVRVQLWTHAAGGLTENDFILAAKIDQAAAR